MRSGVYSITSPTHGLYIGSALNLQRRWREHQSRLSRGTHINAHLQNAWNKYGAENMRFAVLIVCRPEDLIIYEQIAIDALSPRYNIARVAGNSRGIKRTDKTRAKLSERLLGKKQSPEMIAARSAGMRGHTVTPKTRAKLADQRGWKHSNQAKAKMRGRHRTPEHAKKLGLSHMGNKHRLGIPHTEAAKKVISERLRGRRLSDETRSRMRAAHQRRRLASTMNLA